MSRLGRIYLAIYLRPRWWFPKGKRWATWFEWRCDMLLVSEDLYRILLQRVQDGTAKILDDRRHAERAKAGPDGVKHVTHKGLADAARLGHQDQGVNHDRMAVVAGFTSGEIRTTETLFAFVEGLGYNIWLSKPEQYPENGSEAWSETNFMTRAVVDTAKANGHTRYLSIMVKMYGREMCQRLALWGLSGVYKMMDAMKFGQRGVCFRHAPDFVLTSAWAALGFPDLSTLPNQGANPEFLAGFRYVLTDDGQLYVVETLEPPPPVAE